MRSASARLARAKIVRLRSAPSVVVAVAAEIVEIAAAVATTAVIVATAEIAVTVAIAEAVTRLYR
ncbi:MAG TPA: hypothetical protein VNB29_09740 [Chthoniobacterales bacterium]|nr:hypothetical protein [Chthoniobacterales bacterium]